MRIVLALERNSTRSLPIAVVVPPPFPPSPPSSPLLPPLSSLSPPPSLPLPLLLRLVRTFFGSIKGGGVLFPHCFLYPSSSSSLVFLLAFPPPPLSQPSPPAFPPSLLLNKFDAKTTAGGWAAGTLQRQSGRVRKGLPKERHTRRRNGRRSKAHKMGDEGGGGETNSKSAAGEERESSHWVWNAVGMSGEGGGGEGMGELLQYRKRMLLKTREKWRCLSPAKQPTKKQLRSK